MTKQASQPTDDPNDLLSGKCPSCKTVIEVRRSQATPPQLSLPFRQRVRGGDSGGFGAWNELWSAECPTCSVKSSKITSKDGVEGSLMCGPRVYLSRKGSV